MKSFQAEDHVELLLSLSCVAKPMKVRRRTRRRADGAFECRTCGRAFPTFQALGGHRTSCDRHPRMGLTTEAARGWKLKRVVHKCAICGETFATGQALGGHMSRHRAAPGGAPSPCGFDLNLAAPHVEDGGFSGRLLELFN